MSAYKIPCKNDQAKAKKKKRKMGVVLSGVCENSTIVEITRHVPLSGLLSFASLHQKKKTDAVILFCSH
jgi:hypothetical protein